MVEINETDDEFSDVAIVAVEFLNELLEVVESFKRVLGAAKLLDDVFLGMVLSVLIALDNDRFSVFEGANAALFDDVICSSSSSLLEMYLKTGRFLMLAKLSK